MDMIMIKLFFSPDYVFMYGSNQYPEKHQHIFEHLIISMSKPFKILLDERDDVECSGLMISKGISHEFKTALDDMLIFLIDPTTLIAKSMNHVYLNKSPYYILDTEIVEKSEMSGLRLFLIKMFRQIKRISLK